MRFIEHGGRAYRSRLMQLARMYMNVRDCRNCGSPINDGYVCPFCQVDDTTHDFVPPKQTDRIKRPRQLPGQLELIKDGK